MAENVFILGAGASFDSGAPLMNDFLDVAEDLMISGGADNFKEAFEIVFEVIAELQIVYSKSHLDLNNIEALFGAIEMGSIIDRLGKRFGDEIKVARESLIRLIVQTLEKRIKFPFKNGRFNPPGSYGEFAGLVNDMNDCSVITFNYDIALDFALHFNNTHIDYCLGDPRSDALKLLKLHGSINWGGCDECGEIVPYVLGDYLQKYRSNTWTEPKYVWIPFSDRLSDKSHCSKELNSVPVIVPPTWNKNQYHGTLTNVWRHAATELNTARNIFVFGYSLPESDAFFRYLFALGTAGDTRIKRFWVFDPNSSGEVKGRYEKLVGQGIINRFDYFEKTFSQGIKELRQMLDVKKPH